MNHSLHLVEKRVQFRNQDTPNQVPVHLPVVVDEDMPHAADFRPRNLRIRGFDVLLHFPHCFTHDLNMLEVQPSLRHVRIVFLSRRNKMLPDCRNGVQLILHPLNIASHTDVASSRILSRSLGLNNFCSTITSTLHRSSGARAFRNSNIRNGSLPGSLRTKKSTSLSARSSPRATESKIRTSVTHGAFPPAPGSPRASSPPVPASS